MAPAAADCPAVTMEELRRHSSTGDLWVAIAGDVYDVTTWLAEHPGGVVPLITMAGSDVTDAFAALHPPFARRVLPRFRVGRLVDYSVSPASADYRRLLSKLSSAGFFEDVGLLPKIHLVFMALILAFAVHLVLARESCAAHLLAGGLLGWLWIQSGWMGHDSGHHRIVPSPTVNRMLQVLSGNCLTGLSIAWWKHMHNTHHLVCNSLDHDPDLQHMPLFAVSAKLFGNLRSVFYDRIMLFDKLTQFLISYQHWTFYPVMCFARINLFVQSIVFLASKNKVPHRWQEIAGVATFWLWYPLLVSCLPNWGERVMFVVASFAITGIQHVQFCLNHFSSSVYVGPPKGDDWFEKQTAGTLDITCPSWMDWFHGGLQFQIEHHLFPRLPRSHLRKVAPFVRDLCKKHNLPYNAASFWEANLLTWRTLRTAALQAREVGAGPAKNLVWEAMNIQG